MSTTTKIELGDCIETSEDHERTRWTHETGAYVELIRDDEPHHPLDDVEGIAISFREGDRYVGTMDDHPRDPTITCPACDGSGIGDRFDLRDGGRIIASGTSEAMDAVALLFGRSLWDISSRDCTRCQGAGEIDVDLETWFRVEHGARAIHSFDTGNHGEASAVMVVTDDDWTDPAGAAVGFADEYKAWAEGDIWGIECGGPGVETGSCWGFIGREYAEQAARDEYLQGAVLEVTQTRERAAASAIRERDEAAYWACRGIQTV